MSWEFLKSFERTMYGFDRKKKVRKEISAYVFLMTEIYVRGSFALPGASPAD